MRDHLSRELRVFYELARVVAGAPYEVDEILARVAAEIRVAFEFARALVALFDDEEQGLQAVVQQGIDWPGDDWLPLERFPLLQVALDRRAALLSKDPRAEGLLPEEVLDRFGVTSVVVVPLETEGRVVGFFVADRGGEPFELAEAELQLLTAIGSVAAVFIDKAEQYARLQLALEELRRRERAQADFVSVASHELRTPIAVVHGIASTLHERGDALEPGQVSDLLRMLGEQTTRLAALTEQLLDLSRVDAGVLRLRPSTFSPREACEALVPRIAPDRAPEVEFTIDPALELTTDRDAFERVVSNLLANALRYGSPPVVVAGEQGNGDGFLLAVEDAGHGVDPEFIPQLFDRFTRGDRELRGGPTGAGLGLAIASSFAEALGGELRYESALAGGARFVLVLPE